MRSSPPLRIPEDVYSSAMAEAALNGRSTPQQIAHWARIGSALESSPGVNHRDVARILAGDGSYDNLSEREQALARATWRERISEQRDGLNFAVELETAGETWTDAAGDGNSVPRGS